MGSIIGGMAVGAAAMVVGSSANLSLLGGPLERREVGRSEKPGEVRRIERGLESRVAALPFSELMDRKEVYLVCSFLAKISTNSDIDSDLRAVERGRDLRRDGKDGGGGFNNESARWPVLCMSRDGLKKNEGNCESMSKDCESDSKDESELSEGFEREYKDGGFKESVGAAVSEGKVVAEMVASP